MGRIIWNSSNKKWTISEENGYFIVSNGWFCDYPIQYCDGNIAYDYPERIPIYVKNAVKSVMKKFDKFHKMLRDVVSEFYRNLSNYDSAEKCELISQIQDYLESQDMM